MDTPDNNPMNGITLRYNNTIASALSLAYCLKRSTIQTDAKMKKLALQNYFQHMHYSIFEVEPISISLNHSNLIYICLQTLRS